MFSTPAVSAQAERFSDKARSYLFENELGDGRGILKITET